MDMIDYYSTLKTIKQQLLVQRIAIELAVFFKTVCILSSVVCVAGMAVAGLFSNRFSRSLNVFLTIKITDALTFSYSHILAECASILAL